VISEVIKTIDKGKSSGTSLTGIDTGFDKINKLTGGWQKTDLIILAARPSVGKTAMALSLAYNASASKINPQPGAVFSMEMGTIQVVKRMLAAINRIPLSDINQPTQLADSHFTKIKEAQKVAKKLGVYIDDTPALTIAQLRSKVRRLVKKHGIQWVIIDYLQLMRADKSKGNREQEISQISGGLKAIAKEFEIPIIALAQLNRIPDDEEPQLQNLREGGTIEQDADLVLFLWNPDKASIKEDAVNENRKLISCAKHRNGETFADVLEFLKQYQLFSDIETEKPPEPARNPRAGFQSAEDANRRYDPNQWK
jgi:replicative DNA helicase